jgi:hypothetical protein
LGERLIRKSLDIQDELVAAALMAKSGEKEKLLAEISLCIDQLRYLLRLARDSQCMNRDSWYFCAKDLTEVGKMLGGWLKSS